MLPDTSAHPHSVTAPNTAVITSTRGVSPGQCALFPVHSGQNSTLQDPENTALQFNTLPFRECQGRLEILLKGIPAICLLQPGRNRPGIMLIRTAVVPGKTPLVQGRAGLGNHRLAYSYAMRIKAFRTIEPAVHNMLLMHDYTGITQGFGGRENSPG
jgi:hypothetical protein